MTEAVDTESVAQRMEQGAYFPEARAWYSVVYHMPIAERSLFIVIIALALLSAVTCTRAFFTIFPLSKRIPFVVISQDIMEDLPVMRRLRRSNSEDRNLAVLRYFLTSYVERRESYVYDPTALQLSFYNIRSQSTPEVFAAYSNWYDATNPGSPFNLYGNQKVRTVAVDNVRMNNSNKDVGRAQVTFTETVVGDAPSKTRQWLADLTYHYTPFTVRQDIEELSMMNFFGIALDVYRHPDQYHKKEAFDITPMTFTVTAYSSNPYINQ